MISVTDFGLDANVFYFGKICVHGHEYLNTGMGLRYKKKWWCVQCKKDSDKQFRTLNEKEHKKRKKKYYDRLKNEEWYKQKQRIKGAIYRAENRELIAKNAANHRLKNKARILERSRNWKRNNPEKVKASARKYNLENRDKKNLNLIRYRAKKRNANHTPYSKEDIQELFLKSGCQCVYCGYSFKVNKKRVRQLDHFVPLSLGGFDVLNNLVPACISCNSAKRDRIPHEWYAKQPFYSRERWLYILGVLEMSEEVYEMAVYAMKIKSANLS